MSQALDVEPHKCDVEKISERNDELVNEKLHDDAVRMGFAVEMPLNLGQLLGQGSVYTLIEYICDDDVDQVGHLPPPSLCVEYPSLGSPRTQSLKIQQLVVWVHETPRIQGKDHEEN